MIKFLCCLSAPVSAAFCEVTLGLALGLAVSDSEHPGSSRAMAPSAFLTIGMASGRWLPEPPPPFSPYGVGEEGERRSWVV